MTFEETLQVNSNSVGPFFPGDKIYCWAEDKSKIKSDSSHGGKWIKGKLVSVDGSMVGVDLGTRSSEGQYQQDQEGSQSC